jgi:hypothetical protein
MSALPPKADIEQWRATLPDKQRRRLRTAQANIKKWLKGTQQTAKPLHDDVTRALVAWQCFVARIKALSPEQAAAVWHQTVMAEAMATADAA